MGGVKKRLLLGLFLALLMLPTVLSDCTAYSSEIFCSDIRGSCFEFQCGGGLNWHLLSVKDTTINSDNPDQNRSSSLYMDIGSTLNSIRYSLIKFNLSSIQQGAIVESAILHVNVFEAASGEILDVFIYQINESWPENATWNTAPTTTQNPLYQTTINLSMAPYWAEIDIKNMTISWIEKGQPNYGMLLKSNITGVNKYARLSTREHGSFQPLLIINYKTPALIASEADKEIIEQPPEKVPKRGGGGGGDIAVDEESIVEEIVEGEKFFSELIGVIQEESVGDEDYISDKSELIDKKKFSDTKKLIYKNVINFQEKGLLVDIKDKSDDNYELKKNIFITQLIVYSLIIILFISVIVIVSIFKTNKVRLALVEREVKKQEKLRVIFELILKHKRKGASREDIINKLKKRGLDEKTIKHLLSQKYKLKTWAGSYVKTLDEFIEDPMNFQQELKQKEEKE